MRAATEEERLALLVSLRQMKVAQARFSLVFEELQAACEVLPSFSVLDDETGEWQKAPK